MNTVGFLITARLKSTRLPMKLLAKIGEHEIIRHVIRRAKSVKGIGRVVLCTSHQFVNAGIYVVSPELAHRVKHGQRIDIPTLLEQEIAKGRTVNSFPLHEYWLDIGRIDAFNKAQQDIKQEIRNVA